MKHHRPYLIVGQGLTGSLLAWFFHRAEQDVVVVDPGLEVTSSKVGAGIFNPVTGRRLAKTWLADDIFPFAQRTYRAIEDRLNIRCYNPMEIGRIRMNAKEENDWLARCGEPGMADYLTETAAISTDINQPNGAGGIQQGGWMNIPVFLNKVKQRLADGGFLRQEALDYSDIDPESGTWKGDEYAAIIFCEGYEGQQNPWFDWLPFASAKGEILTIRTDSDLDKIANRGIFILPLGDGLFRVGATFDQEDKTLNPTLPKRAELQAKLKELATFSYEVVQHEAAIRPATRLRRPFVGRHPILKNLAILNGMGTKGVTLGPWFASQLVDHLTKAEAIEPEADILRYHSTSKA
jgi:glycine/D-amino acid oxidase-like deaminating enzyme